MMGKGAFSSGGGKTRSKTKDQAMAAHLPPSPKAWRFKPELWPYHNNLGTNHKAASGKIKRRSSA